MTPTRPNPTLAGLPHRPLDALEGARVAILGVPEASPDKLGEVSHSARAPAAIRDGSRPLALQLDQIDLDTGRVIRAGKDAPAEIVDAGDLPLTAADDPAANRGAIEAAIRRVLAAGAHPLVLGGDDSVPIPVLRAFREAGPLTIVQVDAHVDWGDVIRGNPYGYGSPMRRASEMAWVTGMVQVGLRGLGSGTPDQIADACAWGSHLITAAQVRRDGVGAALERVPADAACFVSIDLDGLDPAVMPAVGMPTPGGLSYGDVQDLLEGVAARARLVGAALVELVPERDPDGRAGEVAARLALTLAGLMAGPGPDGPSPIGPAPG